MLRLHRFSYEVYTLVSRNCSAGGVVSGGLGHENLAIVIVNGSGVKPCMAFAFQTLSFQLLGQEVFCADLYFHVFLLGFPK